MGDQANMGEGSAGKGAVRDALASLFEEYRPPFEHFQWPIESMRWNELVYSVLETCSSASIARAAARSMSELNLLEVAKLAEMADTLDEDRIPRRTGLLLGILEEAGLGADEARKALGVISEAARAIQSRFDGKVQRLLRREAQRLVDSVVAALELSALSADDARQSVIRWLQNVLNLPLYLERESTRAFCDEMGAKPEDLVDAADELDINVAILDELIEQWYLGREPSSHEPVEVAPGFTPGEGPTDV